VVTAIVLISGYELNRHAAFLCWGSTATFAVGNVNLICLLLLFTI
jgi:hypothetical protein